MAFGLYVHFPFCKNRCSYCDFYKELHSVEQEKDFYEALKIETELVARDQAVIDPEISTVFIGGGTPTLSNIRRLTDWVELLKKHFTFAGDLEFSIENNPEFVTLEKLEAYRALGINRPVFGVQSFNEKLLKVLKRKHKPFSVYKSIYLTNVLGFENFGVDLIFGLPGQTARMLSADIDQLIDLEPPHISFYQLTVEPGTDLARRVHSGRLKMPDQELNLALYKGGCAQLAEHGYRRYEVSSFAREGFECRHNLGYWEGGDYIGLGPSAHSFVRGRRSSNVADVREYIESLTKKGKRPVVEDRSSLDDRMLEAIMLGLRTARGIDRHQFAARFGVALEKKLDQTQYKIFLESGHLLADSDSVRLSDEGIYLADEITRRLIK
ncbi:MAG: radical SAM family heme chaperone HemW [candidate division Zixibacteria bacterium]|nr:radical SAM family heme chaperone HemW [candidate division Zixibacteria bacterium]